MQYKKCPKSELNYITKREELCSNCNHLEKAINLTKQEIKAVNFSYIERGCIYGTNSRTIYEKFCETLGWDKNKANQFGWQTPLYAKNCDTNRKNDVWFIFYPNYDKNRLDAIVDDCHVVNLIQNNDNEIIEVVDESIGKSNNADRITFVKTRKGYKFLGVYKIVKNGTTRVYKKISDRYPMEGI